MAKHCPFAFSQAPEFRECMGEACVNFEWRHFEKETKTIGSCKFFDRWTGHQWPATGPEMQ